MERWVALADKVYDMLKEHDLVFVFAPTGYGKTMASPHLLERALKGELASRLIHVVPVRALLREIYCEKFSAHSWRFKVGYQSMDRIPGGDKSPYLLAELVVVTLDSFLWNIYKIPVTEILKVLRGVSEGHYYPALAAIETSVVVFDEAHLYIGEPRSGRGGGGGKRWMLTVISAIQALRELGVPLVIATATMPSSLVKALLNTLMLDPAKVGVVYACDGACNNHVKALSNLGLKIETIGGMSSALKWNTKIIEEDKVDEVVNSYCRDGKIILLIANTVDRAVELYRKFKDKCGEVVLIHARLIEEERYKAYKKINEIKEAGRGLIVASPVIEVGVEVDADVLVTEAAPLENIIQRAGRLCRSARKCKGPDVVIMKGVKAGSIYDEDDVRRAVQVVEEELAKGNCIEWRLFGSDSCIPAVDLLELAAPTFAGIYSSSVLAKYLIMDSRPSDLINNMQIDQLFRGLSLVKVLAGRCECKDYGSRECCGDQELLNCISRRYFATSIETLAWLEKNRGQCLVKCEDGNSVRVLVLSARRKGACADYCLKVGCSQTLYNAIYGYGRQVVIAGIYRELKKILGTGETVIDFFVELRGDCYKSGEGAYV
ncbi:MAG: CRISPR-associated helicase Cas3' [Thermoprotei archaeon]|nr:CRISPR-associated helicase Cas3' [Thermoprotei archaeon]